jgi:hypothetical protein
MSLTHTPFVPAKAGTQRRGLLHVFLGPRFRGDERTVMQTDWNCR